jgi:hypothetical protein
MTVLARPPQIYPGGRTGGFRTVSVDLGAVDVDMGMPGHPGSKQRTRQGGRRSGEKVDGLVQVAVGRGQAKLVIRRELDYPGSVEKPAQYQHRMAVAAQRAPTLPRPTLGPLTSEKTGQERDSKLPDREHGGVHVDLWSDRHSSSPSPCHRDVAFSHPTPLLAKAQWVSGS